MDGLALAFVQEDLLDDPEDDEARRKGTPPGASQSASQWLGSCRDRRDALRVRVALSAVRWDGITVGAASEPTMIFSAVVRASCERSADSEVAMTAVASDGMALEFARDWRNNKAVVLCACESDGCALQYASKDLQADKEVRATQIPLNGFPSI